MLFNKMLSRIIQIQVLNLSRSWVGEQRLFMVYLCL